MRMKMELLGLQEACDHRCEDALSMSLRDVELAKKLFGRFLASDDWAWLESIAKTQADNTATEKTEEGDTRDN